MTYSSNQFKEMIKNLDDNKVYYRQLEYNNKKYPHKAGTYINDDTGFYRNGIEVFRYKDNRYILRIYTAWCGEIMIENEVRFNKDKKILKTMCNLFGISNKQLRPFDNKEGLTVLNDFLEGILVDWVNDKNRKCIIKEK